MFKQKLKVKQTEKTTTTQQEFSIWCENVVNVLKGKFIYACNVKWFCMVWEVVLFFVKFSNEFSSSISFNELSL